MVFQPNKGKGQPVRNDPPDLPESGADGMFAYENLPAKYWKKYLYAARFVKLVRAKTPKITLYTLNAKCMLMENGPCADFEAGFYSGEIFIRTADGTTVSERQGSSYQLDSSGGASRLPQKIRELWESFQQVNLSYMKFK